jgi:NAD(P)H-nitrite reductase large subunit
MFKRAMMEDDDELCLCFHVTKRKIKNFIRVEAPRVASQLSNCGGAGTGCGWCRPMLRRLLDEAQQGNSQPTPWPDADSYAAARMRYRQARNGATDPES